MSRGPTCFGLQKAVAREKTRLGALEGKRAERGAAAASKAERDAEKSRKAAEKAGRKRAPRKRAPAKAPPGAASPRPPETTPEPEAARTPPALPEAGTAHRILERAGLQPERFGFSRWGDELIEIRTKGQEVEDLERMEAAQAALRSAMPLYWEDTFSVQTTADFVETIPPEPLRTQIHGPAFDVPAATLRRAAELLEVGFPRSDARVWVGTGPAPGSVRSVVQLATEEPGVGVIVVQVPQRPQSRLPDSSGVLRLGPLVRVLRDIEGEQRPGEPPVYLRVQTTEAGFVTPAALHASGLDHWLPAFRPLPSSSPAPGRRLMIPPGGHEISWDQLMKPTVTRRSGDRLWHAHKCQDCGTGHGAGDGPEVRLTPGLAATLHALLRASEHAEGYMTPRETVAVGWIKVGPWGPLRWMVALQNEHKDALDWSTAYDGAPVDIEFALEEFLSGRYLSIKGHALTQADLIDRLVAYARQVRRQQLQPDEAAKIEKDLREVIKRAEAEGGTPLLAHAARKAIHAIKVALRRPVLERELRTLRDKLAAGQSIAVFTDSPVETGRALAHYLALAGQRLTVLPWRRQIKAAKAVIVDTRGEATPGDMKHAQSVLVTNRMKLARELISRREAVVHLERGDLEFIPPDQHRLA